MTGLREMIFLQSTVPLHGDVLNTMKEKREREAFSPSSSLISLKLV